MKILYIYHITLLLIVTAGYSQSADDIGKIALSIVMPDNVDGLTESQLSKLESKLTNITTQAGFAGVGYDHNFVIYPKLVIYDIEMSEGGMQNVYVATTELSLFIKQVENNVLFSSCSKTIKGSGKTKEAAITSAIGNIPLRDSQFDSFIEKGKTQILKYYELKCGDIVLKAESLVKSQQFEEAIGLLMTVPDAVSCYPQVLNKAVDAFKAYQDQRCKEDIQRAKAALEANDYTLSLAILSGIDPSSVCAKESLSLLKTAGTKVDAEEKRNWDFAMRMYSDSVMLEKMRINAIKEMAVAYYRSRPASVNYLYIIR